MTIEYAIIVKSKTRLELLIERFNTSQQARFYIERQGGDFQDYVQEHQTFSQVLQAVQRKLSAILKYKIIDRSFLPNYLFAENQLIIVVGQDGLVANTAKYSKGRPIIAINPDKARNDGVLLPFTIASFDDAVKAVIAGSSHSRSLPLAQVSLNDGQRLLAFNDLFIGPSSHISARYRISYNGKTEEQSSSGIIISTRAGSTGWLSSIFNMAYGITGLMDKKQHKRDPVFQDHQLLFAVREPFKSVRTQAGICAGILDRNITLEIESLMPNQGVIFSDGIEADFLRFSSGAIARVGVADETATLVLP